MSAQFTLGEMYYNGSGVARDLAQAAFWFFKAQAVAAALFRLGAIIAEGTVVPREFGHPLDLWRSSANKGYAEAQYALGLSYGYASTSVWEDYVEAYKWLSLALSRASAENQKRYAEARDEMAKQMTPAQLAEAQKLAREWIAEFEKQKE